MAQDQVLARGTGFLLTSGVPASLAFRPVAASSVTVANRFNIERFRIDRQSSQKISCRFNLRSHHSLKIVKVLCVGSMFLCALPMFCMSFTCLIRSYESDWLMHIVSIQIFSHPQWVERSMWIVACILSGFGCAPSRTSLRANQVHAEGTIFARAYSRNARLWLL